MEKGADEKVEKKGFLYATPLIEEGSVLLSAPGDHFAINQQYFHKTVILIVEHTSNFTRGVILNRPTAFDTGDLPEALMEAAEQGRGIEESVPLNGTMQKWNIWCGGDCQGLNSRGSGDICALCLHTLEALAPVSRQIIRGVYQIHLSDAQRLVKEGDAEIDDFLLLVGYCGWHPGQLQGELDRGDTWTMAAADQRMLLGQLREVQAQLTVRLLEADTTISPADVGDGIVEWQQLYEALGEEYRSQLEGLDDHTDNMLRRWIGRCLIPPRLQPTPRRGLRAMPATLREGTVFRGSATAWLLGKPAEQSTLDTGFGQGPPGQYLHKSVLLLLKDASFKDPALLVLLNGPKVGESEGMDVLFGGPDRMGSAGVFALVGMEQRFQGFVFLLPRLLPELLAIGALEVAEGVDVEDVVRAPLEERWEVAGGRIDTLEEAAESKIGDVQKRKWYGRFLGMDE